MNRTGDEDKQQRDDLVRQAQEAKQRREQADPPPDLEAALPAFADGQLPDGRDEGVPMHQPVNDGAEAAAAPQAGEARDRDAVGGQRWGKFSDRFKRELTNLQNAHAGNLSREQEQQMRQEATRRAKSRPMQPLGTDHVELSEAVTEAIRGLADDDAQRRDQMLGNAKEAIAGGMDEQAVLDEVGRVRQALAGEEESPTSARAAEGGGAGDDRADAIRAAIREEIQQAIPVLAREIARQLTVS